MTEPEYKFEAHLEGMDCGDRPCDVCAPPPLNVQSTTGAATDPDLRQDFVEVDRKRTWGQKLPIPNEMVPVGTQVADDIRLRMEHGKATYGVYLQAFNGRNALQDLYEELLDASCYVKQLLIEQEERQARKDTNDLVVMSEAEIEALPDDAPTLRAAALRLRRFIKED